jgi:Flp pilus assembly protein TadG
MHDFVRQVLRRFSRDERGNVFILFGATAIPLMLIMGGAVDVTRYLRYKGDLSNAVDSAALALARQDPDATEEEAEIFISDYVNAFAVGDTEFSVEDFEVVKVDNGFQVTATGAMQTMFLPLGQFTSGGGHGINEMPVNITAEVVNQSNRLEVALVLDNTGSMNCAGTVGSCALNWSAPAADSRIVALKSAAKSLVDILMEDDMDDPNQIKIALVPFETAVNVASAATGDLGTVTNWPSWIDSATGQTGTLAKWNGRNFNGWNFSTSANCTPAGTGSCKRVGHRFLFDKLKADNTAVKWAGCVEMRAGTYELSDAAPNASIPDSLYVPYFAPDEPDNSSTGSTSAPISNLNNKTSSSHAGYSYINDYLKDRINPSYPKPGPAQLHMTKYSNNTNIIWQTGAPDTNGSTSPYENGPNRGCPKPIVPLTNADGKAAIKTAIDGMIAYWHGGTYIPAGLVWGWHVLTSGEPYTQGIAPTHDDYSDTVKAVVLLTDGDNQVEPSDETHNASNYTSYSYVNTVVGTERRLATTGSASEGTLDTKLASLCTSVKQNGTSADTSDDIRLYTITFGPLSAAVQTMMETCATLDEGERLHYHAPTSGQLDAIFTEIGEDLREIHLSM